MHSKHDELSSRYAAYPIKRNVAAGPSLNENNRTMTQRQHAAKAISLSLRRLLLRYKKGRIYSGNPVFSLYVVRILLKSFCKG